MTFRLVPLVVLLFLPLASLRADTITLDDGRVLEGDLLSPDDAAMIEIRVTIGDLVAIQRIDRHHIVAIHHGQTDHQRAVAAIRKGIHQLGDAGTAEDWLVLARAARDQNETSLSRELAAKAALLDRHNIEAHHMGGEVLQNGVWMLPREAAIARGEVFFDARWMPWSERAKILAEAAKAHADSLAARQKLLEIEQEDALLEASQRPPAQDPGTLNGSYISGSSGCNTGYYYGFGGPILYGYPVGWNRHGGVVAGGWGVVIQGGSAHSNWSVGFHW